MVLRCVQEMIVRAVKVRVRHWWRNQPYIQQEDTQQSLSLDQRAAELVERVLCWLLPSEVRSHACRLHLAHSAMQEPTSRELSDLFWKVWGVCVLTG